MRPVQGAGVPLHADGEDGVGLGLSMVGSLVDRMGGRMTIENRPSGGVTCAILFPVERVLDHAAE